MLLTPCLLWIALQNGVPMEWTLEEARDRWSPMVRPVQHVGMPGYPFQVGVMWDGALVFGPLEFLGLGVMRMGTTFGGQVQLSAETAADGDSLSVRVSLRGLRVKPKEVVLRLRSGDGRPLRSAELDGKPLPVRADDTVLLPTTLSGEFEVIGRF
ncbi:MAG: hypothetical protein AMXMBFR61_20430 [Fimbriimonadales bacterium]